MDTIPAQGTDAQLSSMPSRERVAVGVLMMLMEHARDLLSVADFVLWSVYGEHAGQGGPDAVPVPRTLDEAIERLVSSGVVRESDVTLAGIRYGRWSEPGA